MLWRALGHVNNGCYIDIGAAWPKKHSVTYIFYKNYWQGINIEPNAFLYEELRKARPRDKNIMVIVSDLPGTDKIYQFEATGLTTLDHTIAASHEQAGFKCEQRQLPVTTLAEIWSEHVPENQEVHFLKIDAEGNERQIIEGNDWTINRPWIVIAEAIHPIDRHELDQGWTDLMDNFGYQFAYWDGLNKFYIAKEHRELLDSFKYPPNVFDGFIQHSEALYKIERDQAIENLSILEKELESVIDRQAQTEETLNNIYQSVSWRIVRLPARSMKKIVHVSKPILKSVIFNGYRIVKQLPWILSSFKFFIQRVPVLESRSQSFITTELKKGSNVPIYSKFAQRKKKSFLNDIQSTPIAQRRIILFYVEHTCTQTIVTGVQRVCHKLVTHLANNNEVIILVKLNPETLGLMPIMEGDYHKFGALSDFEIKEKDKKYYDPQYFDSVLDNLKHSPIQHWLVIPEVTYHVNQEPAPTSRLIKTACDHGLKIGVIFYDNIPLICDSAKENAVRHMRYLSDISVADLIWPISHYSANSLDHYYKNVEQLSVQQMPRISVIPLPEEGSGERIAADRRTRNHAMICVGTIDERKNQVTLIKAFNAYCETHPDTDWELILVGFVRDHYKPIIERETSKNKRIKLYDSANDQEVDRLYQQTAFSVFPSTEEGYGLPVVESLWHLRPCICADSGSIKELAQKGGCLTVDVRKVTALTWAITEMIHNEKIYQEKIAEIVRRPVISWHEYADRISKELQQYSGGNQYSGVIYVWVDATVEVDGNSGIQRVTRQLCRTLLSQNHHLVPVKWNQDNSEVCLANREELEHLAKWNGPSVESWSLDLDPESRNGGKSYLLSDLPLNRPLSIQHQVIDFFKNHGTTCVSIFYDAIPHKMHDVYPENFTQALREFMVMLDRMDQVYSISKTSHDDLAEFLDQAAPKGLALERRLKVVTLPEAFPRGTSTEQRPPADADCCHILSVGTVEPRKNHLCLLEAFLKAEKRSTKTLKLVLVGSGNSFDPSLEGRIQQKIDQSENIRWIKDADDALLREQYQQADFTIYPSIEEGFGLPIVESLWFQRPCICANFGQMAELAANGGCETVDVTNSEELMQAMVNLATNTRRYDELVAQTKTRFFKTWDDYAREIANHLYRLTRNKRRDEQASPPVHSPADLRIPHRPILSVCITTFNRVDWTRLNIKNYFNIAKNLGNKVELIVCDNCSNEKIDDLLDLYRDAKQISIYRNSANIGMLNNLAQTVSLANGEYIWLVGDDDIIHQGALERIVDIIQNHQPELINLNYNITSEAPPTRVEDIDSYLHNAKQIVESTPSHPELAKNLSAFNENFYTAIYSFVAKRNHAWRIFHQDTSGPPFSSLQTCVPSSKYILANLMDVEAYWVGDPLLTINMNVSWGEHAPIWLLERIPEVYDLAELNGVPRQDVDTWRKHTLRSSVSFLETMFETPPPAYVDQFDVARFIRRNKHLAEFEEVFHLLESKYQKAFESHHPLATFAPETLTEIYHDRK